MYTLPTGFSQKLISVAYIYKVSVAIIYSLWILVNYYSEISYHIRAVFLLAVQPWRSGVILILSEPDRLPEEVGHARTHY